MRSMAKAAANSRIVWMSIGFGLALTLELIAQSVTEGTRYISSGGTQLRLLLDAASLGGTEVELGEITFPPGTNTEEHVHGAVEIFYVLSGELEHEVNGKTYILKQGMAGFVRPPDKVRHRVRADSPAKALVIWAPGGEAARITSRWRRAE